MKYIFTLIFILSPLAAAQECHLTCEQPKLPTTSLVMGKKGPKGDRGPVGETGRCACDDFEELRTEVAVIKWKLSVKKLHVESLGCDSPCRVAHCKVYLNGNTDNLCANRRGHNVVVLNPKTSQVVTRDFDTYLEAANVANMISFLEDEVEFGSVVIIAVRDATLSTNFNEEQVAYMRRLGATENCSVKIGTGRISWALITEKREDGTKPEWFECGYKAPYSGKVEFDLNFPFL